MPRMGALISHKRLIPYLLHLAVSILIQYALLKVFISEGLTATAPQISVIVLLYLIPLNIILVLLFSWIYLMRHLSTAPPKTLAKGGRVTPSLIKAGLSQPAFRGVLGITLLFGFLSFIIFVLVYPESLFRLSESLYWSSGLFRGLIKLSYQINKFMVGALGSLALSFRSSILGLIRPLSEATMMLDVRWKYLICQNIAAWATALFILVYVRYSSARRRSPPKA